LSGYPPIFLNSKKRRRNSIAAWPKRFDALPFDSERKLMATRHQQRGGGDAVYVKGAPEVVLPLCVDGAASGAAAHVERLADQGQRVLVLAAGKGEAASFEQTLGGLRLLGLEAMIDPPREAALDAVTASREAGVRVMMITGDHPRTALAIGRTLGLTERGNG
jgi:Ca2+-transporting ATPase